MPACPEGIEANTSNVADWSYVAEGGLHIVCKYLGKDAKYSGRVLRIPKQENSLWLLKQLFLDNVVLPMLESRHMPDNKNVWLTAEFSQGMDAHVEPSRSAERIKKGRIQTLDQPAYLMEDLLVPCSVQDLATKKVPFFLFSLEIKPKGAAPMARGLPSRFVLQAMLKAEKKKAKEKDHDDQHAAEITGYRPTDLFSGEMSRVSHAVDMLIETPSNNLRTYVGGEVKTPKETEALLKNWVPQMIQAESGFFKDIRAIQCLAAGQQETAEALEAALQTTVGEKWTEATLLPETYEKALSNWMGPGNLREAFLTRTAADRKVPEAPEGELLPTQTEHQKEGGRLVEALKAGKGDAEQAAAVEWLCRYLMGRTFLDLSLMINFVALKGDQDKETVDALQAAKFFEVSGTTIPPEVVSSLGVEGPSSVRLFYRISAVDVDLKPVGKIADWADTYRDCVEIAKKLADGGDA
uniref:Inositol-pentakisphosphate 2-kinase n=1 Tax=Chromera velia CCMP2878 TaxID=1169474 RepID=A0A0G4I393_9ALVE|mmetsp:Transcript_44220/g.87229  ORF Transcript_44220/g.87229 Transcript_44220/m.87229 type:complete len:466 (-) Transcript_44220:81-1478(-)|eukprot:Cvel_10583.t1-p1 / transcript=Cvel_10583.t1 / gene=Cvel_10583 / organism=Chromera_velia_CCMP2878 / gene_product=Inositol-pentakisphosphate 2-kinase, putative / transcript_product=Inositol-pentakisphosphate 2-kinase, putative / location=Cvel_scaffold642:7137-10744(+) / protein_length=465 / sequence_SO=supercontig / SO=protein_coding / is_pseudo=false